MKIFSQNFKSYYEVKGYRNEKNNLILDFNEIKRIAREFQLKEEYSFIKAEIDHAVVLCTVVSPEGISVSAIGEAVRETLHGIYRYNPVTAVSEIAYGRAVINYMMFPSTTFSEIDPMQSIYPMIGSRLTDYGKWKLTATVFKGKTVEELFQCRQQEDKALLRMYLAKDPALVKDPALQEDVIAIQGYDRKLNMSLNGTNGGMAHE
ncbi:MAG TPA: hypothetical protein IAA06_10250 [Candidatus Blautia faecavium]|uniref:Uncharacterized protein n=1 Tax=Candidatus Blautia faecavium TaxID=2838487 RepID=A0A9D2LT74_9FIRM|nr:hypothetical protein [Candidatus Blautia faecavium]